MTTRLTLVLPLLLAFLLATVPARAQSPLATDTWTVTPFIGLALDPDADPSLTLAGAVAFPLTEMLAIEGELGHVFDMAPDDADVDSSLTTVHASLLAFFESDFVLTPYLAGGIGLGKFSHQVTTPPLEIKGTEIGFNVGGGVAYRAGDSVWMRADVRYFRHIDNMPSIWRFAGGVTVRVGN
jgi:opacity protein-like surface antigen